jgi:enamine deaminase RidA (YjgF/YER057c/UK114 family)
LKKQHVWPKGHWNWPIGVTHKHGVRCRQMIWVGGQVDLDPNGTVLDPGDLAVQTRNAVANLGKVLEGLECDLADLVKLLCFYVDDGSVGEEAFLDMVAAALPEGARPAITTVPVPSLAYPGMVVEIEGYAMRHEDGRHLPRRIAGSADLSPLPAGFAPAVRCGKMIFVSAQTAEENGALSHAGDIVRQTDRILSQIKAALGQFGADLNDVVKINRWYLGAGKEEDFEPAALACGRYFADPGPAATGVPLPRFPREGQMIKIEVVAMLGENGEHLPQRHVWPRDVWDWTIPLPYKHGLKCHDMIFLGGQVSLDNEGHVVDPGDLKSQTRRAMDNIGKVLRALGADFTDVCKITTVYAGEADGQRLHDNLLIRSSYFPDPGPATTGIPLPVLAYPAMVIEIDAFAMAEPD